MIIVCLPTYDTHNKVHSIKILKYMMNCRKDDKNRLNFNLDMFKPTIRKFGVGYSLVAGCDFWRRSNASGEKELSRYRNIVSMEKLLDPQVDNLDPLQDEFGYNWPLAKEMKRKISYDEKKGCYDSMNTYHLEYRNEREALRNGRFKNMQENIISSILFPVAIVQFCCRRYEGKQDS